MVLLYYSTRNIVKEKRKRKTAANFWDFCKINKTIFKIQVKPTLNETKVSKNETCSLICLQHPKGSVSGLEEASKSKENTKWKQSELCKDLRRIDIQPKF